MGHFYDRNGKPCYTVDGRDSTLRDARKHGWVQSVTETTGVVAKPALTTWLMKEAAKTARMLNPENYVSEDAWLDAVIEKTNARTFAKAAEGSRVHDALECHLLGKSYPDSYTPHVDAAMLELAKIFPGITDWVPEQSFAHPSGYGGKCDLHSPSTGIIVDYKTKDGDFTETDKWGRPKKLAWDQHWQLAAYQDGFGLPRTSGGVIFVSRDCPGKVSSYVWTADEMEQGSRVFGAALQMYKLLKNYDGSFSQ